MYRPNLLFKAPVICGNELTAFMNALQTIGADAALVLNAVELHQFAMIGTETLHQIWERVRQLMRPENSILMVRPNMILTIRSHTSQTCFDRFGFHAGVTLHFIWIFLFHLKWFLKGFGDTRFYSVGIQDRAEDGVLLEFWFTAESHSAMRAGQW